VEIRYAGVVVGRAESIRRAGDASGGRLFLATSEPMPVGTVIELVTGNSIATARVVRVIESPDAATAGMEVRIGNAAELTEEPVVAPPIVVEPPAPDSSAVPEAVSGPEGSLAEGDASEGRATSAYDVSHFEGSGPTDTSNGAGGKRKKRRRR
jgi:hypothetical protein